MSRFRIVGLCSIFAVVGVSLAVAGYAAAQDASPAATGEVATPCLATGEEENKELAQVFLAAWSSGDATTLDEILADDYVHHWGIGADTHGPAAFVERLGEFFTAFPDFQITIDQIFADGDLVAARWTATGTHQGAFQGAAATGRQATWTGINIFRIACGRIAETWSEADHLGRLQQLGLLPVAEATPEA